MDRLASARNIADLRLLTDELCRTLVLMGVAALGADHIRVVDQPSSRRS